MIKLDYVRIGQWTGYGLHVGRRWLFIFSLRPFWHRLIDKREI